MFLAGANRNKLNVNMFRTDRDDDHKQRQPQGLLARDSGDEASRNMQIPIPLNLNGPSNSTLLDALTSTKGKEGTGITQETLTSSKKFPVLRSLTGGQAKKQFFSE